MKVITPRTIKTTVDYVSKCVENEGVKASGNADNSRFVTNTLDALANSARAGIGLKRKTPIDVLSGHTSFLESCPYRKNIQKYIESCGADSRELEDIDTLLRCFDASSPIKLKLDSRIFKGLKRDRKISETISDDLAILRKPGNLIDNYVPVFSSEKEALGKLKTGDVFQMQGEKYISIKNKSGEAERLSMDRETYFELFPPVERFANVQSDFGNCYEVTALNAMIENPQTRENILRCIDAAGADKNISIKFPNSNFKDGINVNYREIEANGQDKYTYGCKGLQLIEHALGKEYEKDFVDYQVEQLKKQGKDSIAATITDLYKRGKTEELTKYCGGEYNSLGTDLREGGDAIVPWYILGLKNNKYVEMGDYSSGSGRVKHLIDDKTWAYKYMTGDAVTGEDEFAELLWSPEFFKNHLVQAFVADKGSQSKLMSNHSYKLSAVLDEKGKVDSYLIKDPQGIVEKKITFDDIFDEIDSICYAEI